MTSIGLFLVLALALGLLLLGLGYYLGQAATARKEAPPDAPSPTPAQGEAGGEEAEGSPKNRAPEDLMPQTAAGLTVRTDPQRGQRLVVRVDGATYLRYDAMTDEHRRRLRTYLLQIRDWMETTRGDLPITPRRQAPRSSPTHQEIPVQDTVAKAKDMVTAINAIVQAKLKAQGQTAAVTIMRDWRGTGVVIMVDGTRYDAVEDVPDKEVQQLIREAAREWEILQQAHKRRG